MNTGRAYYICLNVQSTGLDVKEDNIIEIGAKMIGNNPQVIGGETEEFSSSVFTECPIETEGKLYYLSILESQNTFSVLQLLKSTEEQLKNSKMKKIFPQYLKN